MADRALFPDKIKDSKYRVQGLLTPDGSRSFEGHRKRIAGLTGRELSKVSDADVIEWLSRGEAFCLKLLALRRRVKR